MAAKIFASIMLFLAATGALAAAVHVENGMRDLFGFLGLMFALGFLFAIAATCDLQVPEEDDED